MVVENIVGKPVKGRFMLKGVIAGPETGMTVEVIWKGRLLGTFEKWGGSLWSLETPEVELPPGQHQLEWRVTGPAAQRIQALILMDAQFVRSENGS
jgi:hypothetical protein